MAKLNKFKLFLWSILGFFVTTDAHSDQPDNYLQKDDARSDQSALTAAAIAAAIAADARSDQSADDLQKD